ncbi:MAG: hypothetical protein FJ126_03000 [Deltaproteobacteria bacterium]|nr:hypothetical protein [Deltaproteobacteria bacterium]
MKPLMRIFLPVMLGLLVVVGVPLSAAALVYTPIPFHYNGFHDGAGDTSTPAGDVTLGGVPFSIPESPANNTWYSSVLSGDGTNPLTIPVNIYGVQEVDTLIVTQWGASGSQTVKLEFFGDRGAYSSKVLVGDTDIRDWLNGDYTHYINGTTTINVYTGPSPGFQYRAHYIDKQRIDLGWDFAHQTLTQIILTDTGADYSQRAFLYGVTVGAVSQVSQSGAALLLLLE